MTTVFIVINVLITITALILCVRAWIGLRAVSKTQRRTVANLSPLERRKKALELATKAWLYSVEHGLTFGESHERKVMERLEREVATLENELFNPKAEGIIKPETPKNEPVAVIRCGCHEPCKVLYYKTQCSFCEWSGSSFSKETAEARRVKHEMRHA